MSGDGFFYRPTVLPPIITQPTNGLLGVLIAVILPVTVSAAVGDVAPTGLDVEIRTAPGGGGVAVFSSVNSGNLLGLNVPAFTLGLGQTYYIRARYRIPREVGAWGSEVQIGT